MTIELNKDDLVALVVGSEPNSNLMNKYTVLKYGNWTGGFVDEWAWNKWELYRLDEEELYNIYKECRESQIIEED